MKLMYRILCRLGIHGARAREVVPGVLNGQPIWQATGRVCCVRCGKRVRPNS